MRLDRWGRGRLKVYGSLSRKKKVCVWGVRREMEDSEREFRGLRTRPKGEEPEILYLGDVLSWMPCWGPG